MKNIYHYTDAAALASILENEELWATNAYFMNDHQEIKLGKSVIEEEYNQFSYSEEFKKSPIHSQNELTQLIDTYSNKIPHTLNFNVVSFTKSPDSLYHWFSYCDRGAGYCISFNQSLIEDNLSLFDASSLSIRSMVQEVDYITPSKTHSKNNIIQHIFSDILCQIKSISKKTDYGRLDINQDDLMKDPETKNFYNTFSQLNIEMLTKKGIDFKDEQEVRYIQCSVKKNHKQKFRILDNLAIPYIPIKIAPEWIDEIFIGPALNQELAIKSLEALKETYGINFTITPSKSSLRKI